MPRKSPSTEKEIVPVALAGGGGSRLWPLSRSHYPKQFLDITGKGSFLQQTLCRLSSDESGGVQAPIVVCNEEHRFLVAEQARLCGRELAGLILEPAGRNTAPAMTAAALYALSENENPMLVVMPTDHLIVDAGGFEEAVACAIDQANDGKLVVFGINQFYVHTVFG